MQESLKIFIWIFITLIVHLFRYYHCDCVNKLFIFYFRITLGGDGRFVFMYTISAINKYTHTRGAEIFISVYLFKKDKRCDNSHKEPPYKITVDFCLSLTVSVCVRWYIWRKLITIFSKQFQISLFLFYGVKFGEKKIWW